MIFFLSRRPGMSSQHGWLGAIGWAMHWNTVDTLLDQTSAQLGQWSKNYINYNITFTKQVFILLASLTLCFSPLSCVYTVALDIQEQVGQRRWIYNEKKKNLGLHHPWVNPPLNQWHCLGQAPWWLKGSTRPWQASAGTLSMPVCLPPPSSSSGAPAVLVFAAPCNSWQKRIAPWAAPNSASSGDDEVLRNRAWETLKCFCGFHGLVKGVT